VERINARIGGDGGEGVREIVPRFTLEVRESTAGRP
jgi:hypothetical protein